MKQEMKEMKEMLKKSDMEERIINISSMLSEIFQELGIQPMEQIAILETMKAHNTLQIVIASLKNKEVMKELQKDIKKK